eukprot:CAMPEP_0180712442 /NCGR_PEP_ID=MMETSP1038_2-20121128/11379_1 /TAXON_ID=632150 /ORGANISM="Azadinium spinosum, Strain 3D9" /LENGTH=611 /DNA_ID=CAMNT_0022744717 /DNA_START=23 /DNA_END=1854 /DNA_ORIENTATION=-
MRHLVACALLAATTRIPLVQRVLASSDLNDDCLECASVDSDEQDHALSLLAARGRALAFNAKHVRALDDAGAPTPAPGASHIISDMASRSLRYHPSQLGRSAIFSALGLIVVLLIGSGGYYLKAPPGADHDSDFELDFGPLTGSSLRLLDIQNRALLRPRVHTGGRTPSEACSNDDASGGDPSASREPSIEPPHIQAETPDGGIDRRSIPEEKLLSTWTTARVIASMLIDQGVQNVPWAMWHVGYSGVLLLVLACTFLGFTLWSIGILLEALDKSAAKRGIPRQARSFGIIGFALWGEWGGKLLALLQFASLCMSFQVGVLFAADSLHAASPVITENACIACIIVLVCLLVFCCPFRVTSSLASTGYFVQILNVAALLITAMQVNHLMPPTDRVFLVESGRRMHHAVNSLVFTFAVHLDIPLVYQKMENRREFPKAIALAFGASMTLTMVTALVGYIAFGGRASQNFIDNMGRDGFGEPLAPGLPNSVMRHVCGCLTGLQLVSLQSISMTSILILVEEYLGLAQRPIIRCVWRAGFIGLLLLFAFRLREQMAYVLGLDTALFELVFMIVIPTLAFAWLRWNRMGMVARISLALTIALSCSYCFVGACGAVS